METLTAGYEVAELAENQQPRPATVILSAFPSQALDWKEHGAHAFFEKPASPPELLRTINELLKPSQRRNGSRTLPRDSRVRAGDSRLLRLPALGRFARSDCNWNARELRMPARSLRVYGVP
jgi:hypothetical protein